MKGLKTREKRALAAQAASVANRDTPGSMTSKILSFKGSAGRKSDNGSFGRNVLSLSDGAMSRRVARTTKGLFSYKTTS